MTLLIKFSILTLRQEVGKRHFPLPIGKTYYQLPCHQTPLSSILLELPPPKSGKVSPLVIEILDDNSHLEPSLKRGRAPTSVKSKMFQSKAADTKPSPQKRSKQDDDQLDDAGETRQSK